MHQVLASKSFFQADSVEMTWNSQGSSCLLLTQSEVRGTSTIPPLHHYTITPFYHPQVDKTGGSYYGKQQLHFMSTKGDTAMVGLSPFHQNYISPIHNF